MTQTDNALKPCPFCGKNAQMVRRMNRGFRVAQIKTQLMHCEDDKLQDVEIALGLAQSRADLAPTPPDPRVTALVGSIKSLRDILDRNLIEREGPNTVTLPDGTTHEGPVVDFLHDLMRVQIRALDAALAAFDKGGKADEI